MELLVGLLAALLSITYLTLGIIAIGKVLGFDKKIEIVIQKYYEYEKYARNIKDLAQLLKEYNILLSENEYLVKEYTRLKADNEYLIAVCDDAKEQFEKMEKEEKND